MKIFITGATGYIGREVARKLLEQGHEVHALVRAVPNDSVFDHPRCVSFIGDLEDQSSIKRAMEGCEYVLHLAAYVKPWARKTETYFKVNVQGTINMLEAARRTGIKKFVYSSSCAVLGRSNGKAIDEDHVRDIDFITEYEQSKHLAESYVREYHRKGLNTVIVYTSKVYGPGLWTESNAVSHLIKLFIDGEWHVIPGHGKSVGCFCFVDDVVTGHIQAMERGISGERYILGGENLELNEFFHLIKTISKKNHPLVHIPIWMMKLFGWKEEVVASLFGKEPLVTSKWVKKYNYDLACSSEKAIQQLGYKITPVEEGLSKTINWINNAAF